MGKLQENLRLGQRAIDFLTGLGVRSTNIPDAGRLPGEPPLSPLDKFVLSAARVELAVAPPEVVSRRRLVARLVRDSDSDRETRRELLSCWLAKWGANYFRPYAKPRWRTRCPDERRIRAARRAAQFRAGNCEEKSALTATWLLENRPGDDVILWCSTTDRSHCFVVYGNATPCWSTVIDELSEEAVVVDGWSADCYQARNRRSLVGDRLERPTSFQTMVRFGVWNRSGEHRINEHVKACPPQFSPKFRLEVAHLPPWMYEGEYADFAEFAREAWRLEGVVDDAPALVEALGCDC
jgi:hypothetical protein